MMTRKTHVLTNAFISAILLGALSSCAPATTEPRSTTDNKGELESGSPRCEISISVGENDKVSFGQLIDVKGKVRVEGSCKPPESITVSMKDKKQTVTSYALTFPPGQSSFEFKAELKGPPQKGKFVIEAEGVIREANAGHETIRRVRSNQIRVTSLGKQQ